MNFSISLGRVFVLKDLISTLEDLIIKVSREITINVKTGYRLRPPVSRTPLEFIYVFYFIDDSTGLHSVYSQYQGCEVIFHVSTLLPFTPNNRQQVSLNKKARELKSVFVFSI